MVNTTMDETFDAIDFVINKKYNKIVIQNAKGDNILQFLIKYKTNSTFNIEIYSSDNVVLEKFNRMSEINQDRIINKAIKCFFDTI